MGVPGLFECEDFFLAKADVGTADFVGVQFFLLDEMLKIGLLNLKETFDFLK